MGTQRLLAATSELRLRAEWPRAAVAQGLVAFGAVAGVGFGEGGLEPRSWRLASIAFLALAAAALVARAPILLAPLDRWTIAAFAALTGWTALSAVWSSHPTASLLQGERVLVYASAVFAILLLARRAALAYVLGGTLAGITVVCAYGLARKWIAPPPIDLFEGYLLYQPIGYANGLGIFAAVGILIAFGLALWAHGRLRAVALAPILVLGPTLYFTSSRGAGLALVAGLAVAVVLAGGARNPRLAAVAVVATVGVVAAVLAAARGPALSFSILGNNRPQYWHVAWKDYRDHPVLGAGAGTFGPYWLHHRPPGTRFTRTAHSVYVESLADLGPVGLALILAALGAPLLALRRFRHPLAVAAAGGYVTYLLHTGIDWDWELPATTLPGLVCGAALVVGARRGARPLSPRARTELLTVVAVLGAVEIARLAGGPATPFGP